jgi:hypothetical protein
MSELSQQAEKIYQSQILPHLPMAQLRGKIIAIETESGEYFIDNTVLKAVMQGRKKYPQRPFFCKRIGCRAVYSYKGPVSIHAKEQEQV